MNAFNEINAKALDASVSVLTAKDQAFATSLLTQWKTKGNLSGKQWHWVGVLADRADSIGVPDFTKPAPVSVGSLSGLIHTFKKAKTHLKHPKIHLQTPSGTPVTMTLAGSASKLDGSVKLTNGGPFGNSVWYGAVTVEGVFNPSKTMASGLKAELTDLLRHFSRHPATAAKDYGKMTGNCCFCRKKLSDPASVAVGYGKTCAGHFGLPWGATS